MDERALEEWSNEEIRRALLENGQKDLPVTPTTRPLLLKKLRRLLGKSAKAVSAEEGSNGSKVENESAPATPPGQPVAEKSSFEGYYGVAAGCNEHSATLQLSPFYTSKAEVLQVIKRLPGARFKRFESQKSAEDFSLPSRELENKPNSTEEMTPPSSALPSNHATEVTEKSNDFPSLKTQQLTRFRGLIETGDVVQFADTVWGNPRHLISSGDAPVILQLGCRYNSLHCAVLARQLVVCRELFVILESERFWELVYPDDVGETREKRRSHLIDLYLNMQDKLVSLRNSQLYTSASRHVNDSYTLQSTYLSSCVSHWYLTMEGQWLKHQRFQGYFDGFQALVALSVVFIIIASPSSLSYP